MQLMGLQSRSHRSALGDKLPILCLLTTCKFEKREVGEA